MRDATVRETVALGQKGSWCGALWVHNSLQSRVFRRNESIVSLGGSVAFVSFEIVRWTKQDFFDRRSNSELRFAVDANV
jgi:hypothetical protein